VSELRRPGNCGDDGVASLFNVGISRLFFQKLALDFTSSRPAPQDFAP